MSIKTFAAIDVGSFELSMKIFEFSGRNNWKILEHVRNRIDLGSDTYNDGKISNEKINELCRTINEYIEIMNTYQVVNFRACGTSAIRETENTRILLDQIKQRTGITIEVLSNSEQRFLDYKSVAFNGEVFRKIIGESTAFVDIGGGSIQISLFDNDTLVSTQNMRLGVSRIHELLQQIYGGISKIEELVEEMVSAQISTYKKLYLKDKTIKNIIIVDDYLSTFVSKKIKGKSENAIITAEEYEKFIGMVRNKPLQEVAKFLDITEDTASLTFICAIMLRYIMKAMGAEIIWAPGVTLADGIAYEYAEQNKMLICEHDFEKDIVACAMNMSKRYMGSKKRAETLENITLTIFDGMKKIHGLGKRERFYLRIATILHDCGKYISMLNISECSYQIIMSTEIIGLSHMEREMIANIVRFNHGPFMYYRQIKSSENSITSDAYLIIAKLTAILRVANALDRSHKQKLKGMKAKLVDDKLIITADSLEDITLEKGLVEKRADFFEEVFSIRPIIKQKKII